MKPIRWILQCSMGVLACATSVGQANHSESFENVGSGANGPGGPPVLATRGWIFRNQSNPVGISPYWTEFAGWGQAGSALSHGGFSLWQNSNSRLSAWAILPAIPNQRAGDPLRFWTSAPTNAFGDNNCTLEVRYSPSGGISTGSGPTDVGNFTQVLASIPGTNGHPWTERTYNLPGTGRIAFRLTLGPYSTSYPFTGSYLIDSLQVGNPTPPPYPLPVAGQTVHWTAANSPVAIARNGPGQNPQIPAGGTVIVDAGVQVQFAAGAQLEVAGTIQLAGSTAANVRLRGPGWLKILKGGLVSGEFADLQSFTDLIYGGKAVFIDSAFSDPANPEDFSYDSSGDVGHRFFDGNLDYARQVVSLTRCTFGQGCEVAVLRGWLAARDCTFYRGGKVTLNPGGIGGEAMLVVGASILDNVTVTDAFIDLMQEKHQHRYVGNLSVTGNVYGPGIRLEGGASYHIDTEATLQGNKWPVNFGVNSAGILPGSQLPAQGNEFNEIPDTDDPAPSDEQTVWADPGIPYVVSDNGVAHGQVTILPGVTVKVLPDVIFGFDTDSNGFAQPVLLGEPERPIRIMSYVPGAKWRGLGIGNTRWFGTRWDWCIFEDSDFGVGSVELPIAFDNCVFRRNTRGLGGSAPMTIRKCTFEDNVFSYTGEVFAPNHDVTGFLDANHPANPNTFINNNGDPGPDYYGLSFLPNGGLIARARHNSLENTDSDLRNNWWGVPSGPHHPTHNPGGSGDEVFFGIDAGGFLTPFRTEPPTSSPPPVVRFVTPAVVGAVPGETILLQWTARDEGAITAQRVYYSPDSNLDSAMQLLATVPASARLFEWTVPNIGTPANGANQFLRIVALDDQGQEGIADLVVRISNPTPFTGSMIPTSPAAGTYRPGDGLQTCAAVTPVVGSTYASIELDNDEAGISLGTVYVSGGTGCTVLPTQIPDVSTDRARIRYDAVGSLNQVRSYYGPYFSIRPDPILGDTAPVVALTSLHAGQSYAAGGVIHVAWTASDDEALRSFDVRASYDGGIRWFIVARDLPATARTYDWRLPASAGITEVHLRVVAKDLRFQNSSSESGAFSILPGDWSAWVRGDVNCDGALNNFDIDPFVLAITDAAAFELAFPGCTREHADANGDGLVNNFDINAFVEALVGG